MGGVITSTVHTLLVKLTAYEIMDGWQSRLISPFGVARTAIARIAVPESAG